MSNCSMNKSQGKLKMIKYTGCPEKHMGIKCDAVYIVYSSVKNLNCDNRIVFRTFQIDGDTNLKNLKKSF